MPAASERYREPYTAPPDPPASEPLYPNFRKLLLQANPWIEPWKESFVERPRFAGPGGCGYARKGRLVVAPAACTRAGRGYSWPGSCSDRTVRGVYLHECGHVFHNALDGREIEVLKGLRAIKEPPITGYEPNPMETFAETFRLFAGNPGLLQEGRPRRFEYMMRAGIGLALRLKPWDEGLQRGAPQRFFDQCERWIERGRARRRAALF